MKESAVHGGNVHEIARSQGRSIHRILDFSASINPLGLSSVVRRAIRQAIPLAVHYPEIESQSLRRQLARIHKISEGCLAIGNGSAELISLIPRALHVRHGLVIGPTFVEFERALTQAQARCTYVLAQPDSDYTPPIDEACTILDLQTRIRRTGKPRIDCPIDIVFLCHPNSPTGQVISRAQFHQLYESVRRAGACLLVDEAFIDYCVSRSVLRNVDSMAGLFVLRSFTKFFAIPGLRIGYLAGSEKEMSVIRSLLPPWSVNIVASAAAEAALQDTAYQRQSVTFMNAERKRFRAKLQVLSYVQRVVPSSANFLLVQVSEDYSVPRIVQALCEEGLVIRDCQSFPGIDVPSIRVAVRLPKENDRLLKALKRQLRQ